MERARRAGARPEAQMRRRERGAARGNQRRGPGDARAGTAAPVGELAVLPSNPAAGGGGGIRPMAQRFFDGSGITPLTGTKPAGSGGR